VDKPIEVLLTLCLTWQQFAKVVIGEQPPIPVGCPVAGEALLPRPVKIRLVASHFPRHYISDLAAVTIRSLILFHRLGPSMPGRTHNNPTQPSLSRANSLELVSKLLEPGGLRGF